MARNAVPVRHRDLFHQATPERNRCRERDECRGRLLAPAAAGLLVLVRCVAAITMAHSRQP
jgi:hypothetical protein